MPAFLIAISAVASPRRYPIAAPDTSGLVLVQWAGALMGLLFVFTFGAIVGSFINVVVYRLPKSLNLIRPASACPRCGTTLTWRENIPILGWMILRGRCRFCRSPISVEYPLVELLVASLFAFVFAAWFMHPHLPGLDPRWWAPEWAHDGLHRVWPMALLVCALFASLVAITLIDARTFTIPLSIPWLVAAAAFVTHPLHALALSMTRRGAGALRSSEHPWCIPLAEGPWLAGTLGATLGLVIANVLLARGWLTRSFADYESWEQSHQPAPPAQADDAHTTDPPAPSLRAVLLRTLFLTGPAVAGMFAGFSLGLRWDKPIEGMGAGMLIGLLVGLILRTLVKQPEQARLTEPAWVQYPHARREMVRELAFLATPFLLGWAAYHWLPVTGVGVWLETPPLWLGALGGSLMGTLAGGGIVWAIRILGSLAFGKEAMGLGDVHLMAAVGAVLGWIDPVLAFFVAPFFGLGWAFLGIVGSRLFPALRGRIGTALPYGPHLAAATVLVVLFKPVFELGLSALSGRTIDLP